LPELAQLIPRRRERRADMVAAGVAFEFRQHPLSGFLAEALEVIG